MTISGYGGSLHGLFHELKNDGQNPFNLKTYP